MVASVVVLVTLVAAAFQHNKAHRLVLAAGSSQGESFIIGQAIKVVAERTYPNLKIVVQETGGTSENLRLLEEKKADVATARADVPAGPASRIVAVLYEDKFQLLVPEASLVRRFSDLKGKRMVLPQTGGQYESFLHVAEHFGLHAWDFHFVGATDKEADSLLLAGQADGLFRVRALGNPGIRQLVQNSHLRFVPIEHAAAMRINLPSFNPSVIPEGAYSGNPPVPAADIPTVAIERVLLAHREANAEAIAMLTSVLIEHRQEVALAIPQELADVRPLLAEARMPNVQVGFGAALHPGAKAFYDKDKPSFVTSHADFLASVLTIAVLVGSWVWELRRWIVRRQKNLADSFNHQVILLIASANSSVALIELEEIGAELWRILTEAVGYLDADRISEESFQSFRVIWQIALEAIRDRRATLRP